MSLSIKDSILKFSGYVVLIFGIFIFMVGIGMIFDPDPSDSETGPSIAIVSAAFIIPGIILIQLGRKAHREEERIESIASIVKSYRRITMTDLALKINVSVHLAEKLLSKAVTLGLVRGHFDRTTGEFYTEDSRGQKVEIKFCSSCGAPLDRVYLDGETIKCHTCGAFVK